MKEAWDRYGCAIVVVALLLLGVVGCLIFDWPGGGR